MFSTTSHSKQSPTTGSFTKLTFDIRIQRTPKTSTMQDTFESFIACKVPSRTVMLTGDNTYEAVKSFETDDFSFSSFARIVDKIFDKFPSDGLITVICGDYAVSRGV